jgi:hypothetical protein
MASNACALCCDELENCTADGRTVTIEVSYASKCYVQIVHIYGAEVHKFVTIIVIALGNYNNMRFLNYYCTFQTVTILITTTIPVLTGCCNY